MLVWTVKGHKHLASMINRRYVIDRLTEGGFKKERISSLFGKVMGNLCQRGFAIPVSVKPREEKDDDGNTALILGGETIKAEKVAVNSPDAIVFTKDGLRAGRVLVDIDEGRRLKYILFLWAVWGTLGVLFVQITLTPILKIIPNLIYDYLPKLISNVFFLLKQ